MELEYIEGRYQIRHDARLFSIEEALAHVSWNGHVREAVSFVMPYSRYQEACRISEQFEEVFRIKERRRRG